METPFERAYRFEKVLHELSSTPKHILMKSYDIYSTHEMVIRQGKDVGLCLRETPAGNKYHELKIGRRENPLYGKGVSSKEARRKVIDYLLLEREKQAVMETSCLRL